MKNTITTTSEYAHSLLKKELTASVHSVYRNTANLLISGALLALQTAGSVCSPISLITSLNSQQMAALDLQKGQTVRFDKDSLHIYADPSHAHSFQYKPAHIYNSRLMVPPSPLPCPEFHSRLTDAICSSHISKETRLYPFTSDSDSADSLVVHAARKYLAQCTSLCRKGAYLQAAKTLASLIGLGIGLTPAGDDFLCGVIAGLILTGQSQHPFCDALFAEIRSRLSDTNEISRAFLTCALSHHFSQPVILLSLMPPARHILKSFQEIGHSSGIDTLSGILYTVDIIGGR